MTIGAALFLIAVGAILRFAVAASTTHGINIHTIGDILMIVGAVGLALSLTFMAPWARRRRTSRRVTYEQPGGTVSERRVEEIQHGQAAPGFDEPPRGP
jgi:hypothetical protein